MIPLEKRTDLHFWPAQPGDQPTIRVASVIAFSVLCSLSVCSLCVTFFLIVLQYNIRPLDPNCDVCAPEFAAGVNLGKHDTLTGTVMNVMTISC